jgi:L-threonate 2-dehydrogenase
MCGMDGKAESVCMKTVSIIGMGNMGLPMAQRLIARGTKVLACDIAMPRQELASAAGCTLAATPAHCACADAVLIAVVDAGQIETVLAGARGLLAALKPRTPVLVMSTIAPADAARFAQRIEQAGGLAVDAPMSGGPARAQRGQLSLMLAGSDQALQASAPLTARLANRVFHLGTHAGDAMKMKLVNNLLAGIHLAAGAQALALTRKLGLNPQTALEVMQASSGASWIANDRLSRALQNDYAPRAAAHILAKDVRLAVALADSEQVVVAGAQEALSAFKHALVQGCGDEDDAVLYRLAVQQATGAA